MAGGGAVQSKRVEAETPASNNTLKRAKNGSAFARCDECKSSVPVALIDMHSCSLEAKIKMNLEAQVIEKPAEVKKKKPAERKKASTTTDESPESKPKKRRLTKIKDSNLPKRPLSAFMLFMEDFRKTYKEEHPDSKGVTVVAKEGGEKWKSMTDEEKKPYTEKAAERKAEYEKALQQPREAETADDAGENQDSDELKQDEELCDEDA